MAKSRTRKVQANPRIPRGIQQAVRSEVAKYLEGSYTNLMKISHIQRQQIEQLAEQLGAVEMYLSTLVTAHADLYPPDALPKLEDAPVVDTANSPRMSEGAKAALEQIEAEEGHPLYGPNNDHEQDGA